MQNTKKTATEQNPTDRAIATNQIAVSNLLDCAESQKFISFLEDALEVYFTSDFYACTIQEERRTNYSLSRELINFFNTINQN